ncbi:MAG: GrpB family protein [Candidatus Nomurabacteria bacterium]|nr:GrpB family protein [Candidatus Nomurabacteria bacterium]
MILNSHTIISPYTNEWKDKFSTEKDLILDLLKDKILAIEHIGSTSIPGLSAKPIADIAIIVNEFEPADVFSKDLSKLGYKYNSSSTERHFYIKGDPESFHLSISFANRGGFWVRQILFRDYLRNNPESKKEYEELKKKLLTEDPTGVNSYFAGKDAFVKKILTLANWKENQLYSDYMKDKKLN